MKFDNEYDEAVWQSLLNSTGEGNSESPIGWFAPVDLQPEEAKCIDHYGTTFLIVRENSDGFVTVQTFDTKVHRDRNYADLQRGYALFEAGITDDEARDAVDGYQQAALFTATRENGESLDGAGLPLSADAQRTMYLDTVDFITDNVEDVREFLRVTGHGWLQVGIDFNFTRNRQGAGFWDRTSDPVGQRLTEASHPWGEQVVFVQDDEELGVQ